ncbi:acyltransferase family protein [uncultured Psychroserpens sp.]|uniref:acyltransferase family protein n=1 Tax=uncultured Psychroserpens sp. TaxID=255436 RepID=UPI0026079751|nr:acyltransferase family protein [uncultured Psychroserpens sp.]
MKNKIERIHSLDSLRAIMMLLGLVLHSTETYLIGTNAPWPKDTNATSISLNYLENIIHMFRMPVFFLVAGFFGALLFYERGKVRMLKNRASRILLPFIVFLLILYPIVVFSLEYSTALFEGQSNAFAETLKNFNQFIPEWTLHLWFLYYLVIISGLTVLIALVLNKVSRLKHFIASIFNIIFQKSIGKIFIFALIIFILLLLIWDLGPPVPLGFIPDINALIFYLFFYGVGWVLFKLKHQLNNFKRNDWAYVSIAIVIFTIQFVYSDVIGDVEQGLMSALIMSLFLFGIIGLFIRYFNSNSKRMRYASDASYWIYLIHIPFTIIIPGLIAGWILPAIVKFLITLIISTVICFLTYHYLVRSTFIGKFLNGRKYSIH